MTQENIWLSNNSADVHSFIWNTVYIFISPSHCWRNLVLLSCVSSSSAVSDLSASRHPSSSKIYRLTIGTIGFSARPKASRVKCWASVAVDHICFQKELGFLTSSFDASHRCPTHWRLHSSSTPHWNLTSWSQNPPNHHCPLPDRNQKLLTVLTESKYWAHNYWRATRVWTFLLFSFLLGHLGLFCVVFFVIIGLCLTERELVTKQLVPTRTLFHLYIRPGVFWILNCWTRTQLVTEKIFLKTQTFLSLNWLYLAGHRCHLSLF